MVKEQHTARRRPQAREVGRGFGRTHQHNSHHHNSTRPFNNKHNSFRNQNSHHRGRNERPHHHRNDRNRKPQTEEQLNSKLNQYWAKGQKETIVAEDGTTKVVSKGTADKFNDDLDNYWKRKEEDAVEEGEGEKKKETEKA